MTSEPERAYVWVWLPTTTEPVVAGVLEPVGDVIGFNYGRSYLERSDSIPLFTPDLPLQPGRHTPSHGGPVPGPIADAMPDAWGQRVVLHRVFGRVGTDPDPGVLGPLTYLLESGSDRIGGLDFQARPDRYEPRGTPATLEEMLEATRRLEAGVPFSPQLDAALLHGSSLGGARPKVAVDDGGPGKLAKLSSSTDPYPVVKAEGVAMLLAADVGLDVASVEVTECLGRGVLLVERFDRTHRRGERRLMISAMTILGLWEMTARHGTYHHLAEQIRRRFTQPSATLRELFSRIVFNVCVGNTDDHAKNHSAFWDGTDLTLTPAYDICPQVRTGGEVAQAMEIAPGRRLSTLANCIEAAPHFLLDRNDAQEIVDRQIDTIRSHWEASAERARLTAAERTYLWRRQILNPFIFEHH